MPFKPFDVSCFKPFKITFKKEKDNAMIKNNHYKLINVDYVDKMLDQLCLGKTLGMGWGWQEFGRPMPSEWMTISSIRNMLIPSPQLRRKK